MTDMGQPSVGGQAGRSVNPTSSPTDGSLVNVGSPGIGLVDGTEAGDAGEGLADAPAVVAVVVACDPGPEFVETLSSLGEQDYENLSVLVIDAGSKDPVADRVAEVLPDAYLHRLAGDPGWSVAANQAIELVSGSPFLLFCHDDVALTADCVSELMSELYRSNAGIAGPKLVQWQDDRRLLQLGMGSDRFGVLVDQVDDGEFDQDQYDAVRDVFVVPGAVQLIRADLFAALGGFDTTIKMLGEDLDLCWRAQIAGARVIVVPSAKARHREAMDERITLHERRRLYTQHRLRTVLATASRGSFLTIILAVLLILLESAYSVLAGRRAQARDVLGAIPWNISHLGDLRRKRQQVKRIRTVSNSDVARRQVAGSARLANFSRGQFSAGQDRFSMLLGSVRSSFRGDDSSNVRDATVVSGLLLVLFFFGSRNLFIDGVATAGEFPDVPSGMDLVREWASGWRSVGTGGKANAPTALLLIGLAKTLMGWAPGMFDTLMVLGPIVIGAVGVYRLARPLASPRAGAVGAFFYACNPLVVSAMASARWGALIIFAAAPYLIGSLNRLFGVRPYGRIGGAPGPTIADRHLAARFLRFGILVAFVASFNPAVIPLAVLMAILIGVTCFVVEPATDLRRSFGAGVAAVVVPVALHGPWSFDLIRDVSWSWIVGPASPEAQASSMLDLLLFAPGSPPARLLSLALVAAAVLSLIFCRRDLYHLAASGWTLATSSFLLLWADLRGWMPFSLPNAETVLAVAAAGLSLSIVAGVRSVELERISTEGLSRPMRLASAGGIACGALVGLVALLSTLSGVWESPTQSFSDSTRFLVDGQFETNAERGQGRILWVGDPSVVPLDVLSSPGGVNYAVYDGGGTDLRGRWVAGPVGSTGGVGEALDLAVGGDVVRLGRLLAPYGINHIVVVRQLAPAPYVGPTVSPGEGVLSSLSQQLDLERVPGVLNLVVFRNTSASGMAPLLPDIEASAASTARQQLDVDLSGGGAQFTQPGPGRWELAVPDERAVLLAVEQNGLTVSGARNESVPGFDGLMVIPGGSSGEVVVAYESRLPRRLAIAGQFLLVLIGVVLAQTRREERVR